MKQIAYITDTHLDEEFPKKQGVDARENWRRILKDIESRNLDQVIFGGDIGTSGSHEWFFESIKSFDVHVVLGNHDSYAAVMRYYKKWAGTGEALYYAFEDESIKYIFLDSSSAELGQEQFDWLKDQLKTEKNILLTIHHPVLKIDTPVDRSYPLHGREEIGNLLHASQCDIVILCGHYHTTDEQVEGNIKQITTLAASYQIKQHIEETEVMTNTFGYRIITVDEAKIATELFLFENGKFIAESAKQ